MSSEDEFGQEVDRVVRSTMMAIGQVREQLARAQATRATARHQEVARVAGEHREQIAMVYDRVRREDFWRTAGHQDVAELATFTSTIAPHDARGREAHQVVREQVGARFGVDVDAVARAHPNPADRTNALWHALDDAAAAQREDAQAREDFAEADELDERASDKAAQADPSADVDAQRADDTREDAREHLVEHDRLHDSAKTHAGEASKTGAVDGPAYAPVTEDELKHAPAAAATARREAATNFPASANATLRGARHGAAPRARTNRSRAHTRDHAAELTR
ncbi:MULTISPECIES: hypothetical protein [Cellulosimicrobium]|uniref:hypothetical protein n=1 Tax=Cellulosimicrobium TaxID=157920 RepID=UPI001BA99F31|nr:hypothetical protein [Cellulosimicrobium cellulans]QUC01993.1 hypothetical protein J5A69_19615 [Cellulosimicrobium cellulans]